MQMLLVIYVMNLPIIIAENSLMARPQFFSLMIYDIVFMMDRILDLFVGFINKEGQFENKLRNVITKNFSSTFYLEAFYAFSPLFLFNINQMQSMVYFLIKIPRFNRLFDMDQAV